MLAFIGMPGWPELLILGTLVLLLFGGAKLPGLMRNMGRSINEFKTGIKEQPAEVPPVEDKSGEAE
ncbi:MAG: twin-arginine translocase TatA/TatE family subunit [Mariniblastus sp.]|nr:twin-arginine translocase TatA/TatE family subunit [Mariniblastus sp.]